MHIASYIYRAWTRANDVVNIILLTVHLYLTKKNLKKSRIYNLQYSSPSITKYNYPWKVNLASQLFLFFTFLLYTGIQFSSVAHLCLTLCDPVDCRTPGLSVHHQLPELAQTHVHWIGDAIPPSHPGLSTSPPTFNLPQHEGLFQWVSFSHQVAKVLEFQLSISPSSEYSGLVSFRIDWFDLLAVQGTLRNLLQHHSSKASILQHSAFLTVQLSHPYMTTGKTIALTRWTFAGKVMSLLLNMLSRLVITPRSKRLLISWLQSPSSVILEPKK